MGRTLIRRIRDRRGVSAVEAALALPVILLAVAIGYDLTHYGNTQSRIRNVAFRVADFAAADDGLGRVGRLTDIADVRAAAGSMLVPLTICDVTSIVLSGVTNQDGKGPIIAWQEKWSYPKKEGGNDCPAVATPDLTSGLGKIGQPPDFPAVLPNQAIRAMAVKQKDSVIIAELVFRDVKTILPKILEATMPTTHFAAGAARVRSQIP